MISFNFRTRRKNARLFFFSLILACISACSEQSPSHGIRLADGSVYHGDTKDGILHGYGELSYLNGSRYQGQFENGAFHGKGRLFYLNGDVYHGDFLSGAVTGKGVYTTKDSTVYEGNFYQGDAHGFVEINNPKAGYTYAGHMDNWSFSGYGEFVRGDVNYQGYFVDSVYQGQGTLIDSQGGVYSGEFYNGLYHGIGIYEIDGSAYKGQFFDGALTGYGTLQKDNKVVYAGEFQDWVFNGNGKYTDESGNVILGNFVQGYITGKGTLVSIDGQQYSGDFNYGQYDGLGVLSLADGRVYKGEFSYGRYDGQGRLETPGDDENEAGVQQGRWQYGRLVYNEVTGESLGTQAEIALEQHQTRLNEVLSSLKESEANKNNMYFLGLGGDGTQSVFRREVEFVDAQLGSRFDLDGRRVHLINDHQTAEQYPLATSRSFTQAINGIAQKMDKENDVLFLYLTSHGSQDHELALGHDSINFPAMPASLIGKVIRESGIKWKVVIISACYSGGFIPELDDGTTLIMTASDAENTSFGCSDDSKMTYFGKALFKEVLAQDRKLNLGEAFLKAVGIIAQWEEDEELTPSNPMIVEQDTVVDLLQAMSK